MNTIFGGSSGCCFCCSYFCALHKHGLWLQFLLPVPWDLFSHLSKEEATTCTLCCSRNPSRKSRIVCNFRF
jgi:hypothetical protein